MKKIILLLIPCFLFISIQKIKASHAVGANITYEYVSPNNYLITVKFYRDCNGSPLALPTTSIDVDYTSVSCGVVGGLVTLNAVPGTGAEINTGLFPPCNVTTCNGGNGYGVQEWVYSGLLNLPSTCNDWVISATINARNALITTINNTSGLLSMYVETTLDNLNFPVNSSPVFSNYPVSTFCLNHSFTYNQGAVDPDHDTLRFSLVDALSGSGTVVPYYTPYSGTNPFSSSTGVTIDSLTGIISFTPSVIQVGVMAVLIKEFRNGTLIGSVRRDMQVNIEATCNFPPVLQPATFNSIQATCGDSILYLHLTTPVRCNTVASDGSDFRMLSPSGGPIPITREVPINCIGGLTDSIEIHLYPPNLNENGTYYIWSKVGNDGNTLLNQCGNAMNEYDTASFYFNNCFRGVVNLTNVSVDNANANMEVYWTAPDSIPPGHFQNFEILRSNYPGGPYYTTGNVNSQSASSFIDSDTALRIPLQPYNYEVKLHLNTGFVSPASDSIQSIFLSDPVSDSLTLMLNWTSYWGWSHPLYQVMESNDSGATFFPVPGDTTSNTSLLYTKPLIPGSYLVRIQTSNGSFVSRSNWYRFDVPAPDTITIVNVITPNDDNLNEHFEFKNLELYPNSKLNIFNRWGRKVYESNNYQNDWKGGDLVDGVYYYTLKIADNKSTEKKGTVSIIRNK